MRLAEVPSHSNGLGDPRTGTVSWKSERNGPILRVITHALPRMPCAERGSHCDNRTAAVPAVWHENCVIFDPGELASEDAQHGPVPDRPEPPEWRAVTAGPSVHTSRDAPFARAKFGRREPHARSEGAT